MPDNVEAHLSALFKKQFREEPEGIAPLSSHASKRKLYRLHAGKVYCIGVHHLNSAENKAFIGFSKHFRSFGLAVPEIYAENLGGHIYLEEDLGDVTLYDALLKARGKEAAFPAAIERYYEQALTELPRFQVEAGKTLDYSLCCESQVYDKTAMRADMEYFKNSFLTPVKVSFNTQELEKNFDRFAEYIVGAGLHYFMYRDFQARNIMLFNEKVYFIDYQTGRKGPLQYDVVSLLFQSQAGIPKEVRARLLHGYLDALSAHLPVDRSEFLQYFYGCAVLRLLQVLGAYGKLGLGEGKEYFLNGIPHAINNMTQIMDEIGLPIGLAELERILKVLRSYDSKEKRCLQN